MSSLTFSPDELELLVNTVDALSAYMGKPVLAEIDTSEDGYEWIAFGVPLDSQEEPDEEAVIMQMGGANARLLGQTASLDDFNKVVYDCEFLWGIQITDDEYLRYVRIDHDGDEVEWSEDLSTLLPFGMSDDDLLEDMAAADALEDDDDDDYDDDEFDDEDFLGEEDPNFKPNLPH